MTKSEIERIKDVYEKRKRIIPEDRYSLFNPGNLFAVQMRERNMLRILKGSGITSFADKKILDIGCGTGREIINFIRYGCLPENCSGIDLLPDRIETARKLSSDIDFRLGNAETLPYEDSHFDIVLSFTVFTSILDKKMKHNIASEMLRVLTPNGIILWYDYHMNNPINPDVKGVKKKEIYELFSGCDISLKRITLAPPLARTIVPVSVILCQILEKIPLFCTHYIGVIRKKAL